MDLKAAWIICVKIYLCSIQSTFRNIIGKTLTNINLKLYFLLLTAHVGPPNPGWQPHWNAVGVIGVHDPLFWHGFGPVLHTDAYKYENKRFFLPNSYSYEQMINHGEKSIVPEHHCKRVTNNYCSLLHKNEKIFFTSQVGPMWDGGQVQSKNGGVASTAQIPLFLHGFGEQLLS